MKHLILLPLLSVGMLQANSPMMDAGKNMIPSHYLSLTDDNSEGSSNGSQSESGSVRMAAAVFKAQEYCRAELKDFEFDARFDVVGATVYFSGANFINPSKGTITSSSLKPIRNLMDRCAPGSIIIFDEVKVIGPDKKLRTIPGISLMLY
ncbi:MAG: hypothetical protein IPP72_19475 [Chitinophagaceae bacterium]|nr:hypothetical protein [Chitinophagaceae bacterium]